MLPVRGIPKLVIAYRPSCLIAKSNYFLKCSFFTKVNYIDKGGASGFTKPKPAYILAERVWLSTKYHEQALVYYHIYYYNLTSASLLSLYISLPRCLCGASHLILHGT
ncbi:MAG: hypothetical protein M3156_02235 [Thermoproteota archaeon]|jgi:hypothetical protein|nr:hypothetical protein [Thermoproteota archaeon]